MVGRPPELIVSDLIQEIQAVLPNANTLPGSVLREVLINPPAGQISQLYDALDTISQAQTIAEATGSDLDRLASNFGLTRDSGRAAVGELVLVFTSSVASISITVNDGIAVATNEKINTIEFAIMGTHVFQPIDKDFYAAEAVRLNSSLQLAGITNAQYVSTVPIQALFSGSTGNVGPYTIIRGNIPGVSAVVNLSPTVGGVDSEPDASLRRRITLVLSGSSSGTVEGLTSIALANPAVTDAAVIRPGDPLMTRDGSEFDSQGNLIKAGTGRSVDLYIKGDLPVTNTETLSFVDHSDGGSITTQDNLVLGYDEVSSTNIFAKQPIEEILDLTGSISGANFKKGQSVTDSEGNVVLTGNYVLLSDMEQELGDAPIMIVRDNTTGETKVAIYLSPISNRYSLIEKVAASGRGNSALGLDSIFWLTNVATVNQEVLSRGAEYNGSDALAHSNVAQIQAVNEDVILTKESILITSQGMSQNVFVVYTKHQPIVSITQIRHSRLGFDYDFQLLDANLGKIQLIGRFVPQAGDIIQISYTWRQPHLQNIEYFLQGDTIKWARDPFERPQSKGLTLLDTTTLQSTLDLQIQPLIPTFLGLQANQLTSRAQYTMTVKGDKARIATDQVVTFKPNTLFGTDFWFATQIQQSATASKSRLGRVVSIRNLTKGFAYNLENMALNTNIYDPTVRVVENLGDNEFLLDGTLNTRHMDVGDKILFSRKSLMRHWTTTNDFTNNIFGNPAPTYDSVFTSFANDQITVKRQEDDVTSPATVISGSIATSGTLSGIVEIIDDTIIEPGVMVVISPNTVIRFRNSSSLNNVQTTQELIVLNNTIAISDIDGAINIIENVYIFEKPSTAPFFIILNTTGTETMSIYYDRDVIRKTVSQRDIAGLPTSYNYYIGDKLVPTEFVGTPTGNGLAAAIATTGVFLGYRRDNGDNTTSFFSKINLIGGRNQYGVLLTHEPRITGTVTDDFSFFQSSNPDALFTDIAYDQDRNVFLVGSLAIETSYTVEYFIEVIRRLSLRVRGTLRVSPDVTEDTPIVFTSTAATAAPGDWEGIIFEPTSHTNAVGNPFGTSYLINCVIKYARIGIQNNTSDPFLDRCIIKKCLDGAYTVTSSFFPIHGYTNSSFRLLGNDFTPTGRSYVELRFDTEGYGYGYGPEVSDRTLSLKFTDLFATADGRMPLFKKAGFEELVALDTLGQSGFGSKYVVDFNYGVDYEVYIDNTPIFPGFDADFSIEYDRVRGGFLLSFYNTQRTQNFLTLRAGNPNVITVDFYAIYDNGSINGSIINDNGNCAVDVDKLAAIALSNNTIHNNQFYGITVDESYVFAANDLITGYAIVPVLQDSKSVVNISTSDLWSLPITNAEQNEIAEVDTLELDTSDTDTILVVDTPVLYKANTIIKMDGEFMQVQSVLGDRILVIRGYNNTTPVVHKAGATVYIQRTRTIFTVTGVPGNYCEIREVSSNGVPLANREPITMLKIANNTFRVSFSIDRSATFHYRFQYKENLTDQYWIASEVRKIIVEQFGNAVNNFINPDHEVLAVVGGSEITNYSDNPLYKQPEFENFEIPDNSPSSRDYSKYATPYDPTEPRLVFLGRSPVTQEVTLTAGTSTVILDFIPIVTIGFPTDVIIQMVSNPDRKLVAASFNPITKALSLNNPVTSANVGIYDVLYYRPITLGTLISPFPLTTSVIYQYDEQRVVDFTKLIWRTTGGSGEVKMRFRVANNLADLSNQPVSNFDASSPFDLSSGTGTFPRGSVIEIDVVVATNDAGFAADGTPLFPKLEDFSLFLTPARDNVFYNILRLEYDTKSSKTVVTIEDSENEGLGIRNSTFATIGTDDALSIILRKAEDKFLESAEFVIGEADAISAGNTQIKVQGNVIEQRSAPDSNDEVLADLIYVDLDDSEDVMFIESGTQVTTSRFYAVNSITTKVVIDKVVADLATETLSIVALDQPAPGAQYFVDYTFAAPLDGELITVSYTYNNAVRSVAQPVDDQKVLTSDVLVRAAVAVPLRIEANVFIDTGFNASSIVIDIASALSTFLTSRASFGGTIAVNDVEAIITNITGVQNVKLNVLSRTPANQVVDITLTAREYGVLASGNPLLTVSLASNPTQVLTTNSI
jgi:uncharacterized phage protein gp47/JayE